MHVDIGVYLAFDGHQRWGSSGTAVLLDFGLCIR
jgi:hypothetical protein